MSASFLIAQISDMHVRAEPDPSGFDPALRLREALAVVKSWGVDAIVASGDLVNDEKPEEYVQLAQLLRAPPAPLFLLPGNHDEGAGLRTAFPEHGYLPREGPLSYVIEDFPVRLVCIDDTAPGEVGGVFTRAQAEWLDEALSADPHKPTLVALHHPPFGTHDLLLDTIGLAHADRFAAVIARHAQVGRIVCGHHHRAVLGQVAHCPVVVAPSTAWSFSLALRQGQPVARRLDEGRGWVLHAWSDKAGFASHFMSL
jgi:3',5'-cyclic-AMP phosphodiesterase